MPLLGIPLCAWITGGVGVGAVGGSYVIGNAAEQVGIGAVRVTQGLALVGTAYVAVQIAKQLK